MNQTDTPRTETYLEQATADRPKRPNVFDLCRTLERDNAKLKAALAAVIGGWDEWANKGQIERAIERGRAVLEQT